MHFSRGLNKHETLWLGCRNCGEVKGGWKIISRRELPAERLGQKKKAQ